MTNITNTNTNTIAQALRTASVALFDDHSYDAKRNAQRNLEGRTHYVDDGTLRYFSARVLSSTEMMSGTFFRIIESSASNWEKTERGVRVVMFDVFGETVYRPDLDGMHRTRQQAEKAFWVWAETFDPFAYYREKLESRAGVLIKEAARIQAAANSI